MATGLDIDPAPPAYPAAARNRGAVPRGRGGAGPQLPSLTGLRAAAALSVFCFHTSSYGTQGSAWWQVTDVGFIGVSFFFVLSGVVLTWSGPDAPAARPFWARRAGRILPAHIALTVVAAILYTRWQPANEPLWALALTLVLVQAWVPSDLVMKAGNGVSWSLSCESFFYLCFPWLKRRMITATVRRRVWATALAVAVMVAVSTTASFAFAGRYDVLVYENPLLRLGDFFVGIMLGIALREGRLPRTRVLWPWLALAAAMAACLFVGHARSGAVPRGLTDSLGLLPLTWLVATYAGRDIRGQGSLFARPVVTYLGRISFAFYLVHQVMQAVVAHAWPWAAGDLGRDLSRTLVSLALSLAAAVAIHHLIELPGQRRTARLVDSSTAVARLRARVGT